MDRSAQLEFCQKCTNKSFSPKKGVICGLTGEHAAFSGSCPDFVEDEREAELMEQEKKARRKMEQEENSLGLSKIGIKNGIAAGVIFMVLAVAWFVVGIVSLDRIFFYPPILFVIGIIALVRGINQRKKEKLAQNDILDSQL